MTLQELRDAYKVKFGKNPFNGWKEETLQEKLNNVEIKEETNVVELTKPVKTEEIDWTTKSEEERLAEVERQQALNIRVIEQIVPIYLEGEPFAVIDGKYVPWHKAEIILVEREIQKQQKKLEKLKSKDI
jgi:hypothetical protein